MAGGALPENVFWVVSGAVTFGASTHFEGVILGKTGITLGNLDHRGQIVANRGADGPDEGGRGCWLVGVRRIISVGDFVDGS